MSIYITMKFSVHYVLGRRTECDHLPASLIMICIYGTEDDQVATLACGPGLTLKSVLFPFM